MQVEAGLACLAGLADLAGLAWLLGLAGLAGPTIRDLGQIYWDQDT